MRLHAIQSLALGLAVWIATGVLFFLPGVPWLIGVVYGIILALKANKGESFEVPVIYNIVKRYI
ncbi:MAG: hypothetical protein AAGU73_09650 [Actinomycetota bacterium]